MTQPLAPHWALWAKSPRGQKGMPADAYHPLMYHLIDVAMVARALWANTVPPSVRARVATELGLPDDDLAGDWFAFWAGLHDIGKGSPDFADEWTPGWKRILQAGLEPLAARQKDRPRHSFVSTKLLYGLFQEIGLEPDAGRAVARVVGGHHGRFPQDGDLQNVLRITLGGTSWERARREVVLGLREVCGLESRPAPERNIRRSHWLLMILAGLTSVADWIGSDTGLFPFVAPGVEPRDYGDVARRQADRALEQLGWTGWQGHRGPLPFDALFPYPPNTLQSTVVELAESLPPPAMVLVESPMGGGKTEAALYLADHWNHDHGQNGCYFALPTQATSNHIFTRVRDFLARRYPEDVVNLHLLHGHAALSAEYQALRENSERALRPQGIAGDVGSDGASSNLVAAEWFTRRKRGLLAPFGVGTVDQVMLSVLQTRHYFVRLYGLAGKTVIVDEVHAYDAFMSEILERLLAWLASLGCSVVLLSATLPAVRRKSLLSAFASGLVTASVARIEEVEYPRITWLASHGAGAVTVPTVAQQPVAVKWVNGSLPDDGQEVAFPLGEELAAALAGGGCAAVICNTVGAAQQVYCALKGCFSGEELDLFHARFPFSERDAREKRTLWRFGKSAEGDTSRPHRFVLIGTQVIEQSLDLDFDLMVSELAPVDLVLQRMGRLHRHDRKDRPASVKEPQLWLIEPQTDDKGLPRFGRAVERVYDHHVLLRSWMVLKDREKIAVPQDVEPLVEAVYGEQADLSHLSEPLRGRLEQTRVVLDSKRERHRNQAASHLVGAPDPKQDLLLQKNQQLEEENPEVHQVIQALTRLSEPSVPVVLLPQTEVSSVDLTTEPNRRQMLYLLGRSVTLTHGGVVPLLLKRETPAGWRMSPLLRHHRLMVLNQNSVEEVGDWLVEEHPELGVLIRYRREEREE